MKVSKSKFNFSIILRIIPCHRAIKTNGELGGFQGGIKMKCMLLEMEGIEFSERGRVITDRIFY